MGFWLTANLVAFLGALCTNYVTQIQEGRFVFCPLDHDRSNCMSIQTKKYADVIIPRGADNLVAINLIVQHIQDILNGGLTKRQNGCVNGYSTPRKRKTSESSSRPH